MPLIKIEHLANATLGVWETTESEDFFLKQIPREYLSGYEAKKFTEKRRKEFLASRFLLKKVLGDESISLTIDKNGKPKDNNGKCYLSISHSGNRVAAMTSSIFPVGIDIEQIHPRVKKVMRKFLNETEKIALGENPELWRITLCWSAKESIFKMVEKPGLSFSNDIKLDVPASENGSFAAMVKTDSQWQQIPLHFERAEDYVLTFCVNFKSP